MAASATEILATLLELGDESIAEHSKKFFKTGKGEYGEGDLFLGIRVPVIRKSAAKYNNISLRDVQILLCSGYHEVRLFALVVMVEKYRKGAIQEREEIYRLYLDNTQYINNWDLVDTSAHKIVGPLLYRRDRALLVELANSGILWERRIAIMATFHFIRQGQYEDTLKIAEILLQDSEDLIHKAVGWMLRETGKRALVVEEKFLLQHYKKMPRTMLRYAIEKFPRGERKKYLCGEK